MEQDKIIELLNDAKTNKECWDCAGAVYENGICSYCGENN